MVHFYIKANMKKLDVDTLTKSKGELHPFNNHQVVCNH